MKNNAFTLLELLVVIGIIGVVMAVGVVSYTTISKNSRNARRNADLEAIRQALEMCRSVDGEYPVSIYETVTCPNSTSVITLKSTPKDPKPCVSGERYNYVVNGNGYELTANCYEGGALTVTNP